MWPPFSATALYRNCFLRSAMKSCMQEEIQFSHFLYQKYRTEVPSLDKFLENLELIQKGFQVLLPD